MQKTNDTKKKKQVKYDNPIEALKDAGVAGAAATADKLAHMPVDFLNQLMGQAPATRSGEIAPGETMEMEKVLSGQYETEVQLRKQVAHERRMRAEESSWVESRQNELRMQLNAIQSEAYQLATKVEKVSTQAKLAALQSTDRPSEYDISFFRNLIESLQSFSARVEKAGHWLEKFNKRSAKKGWVSNYKKHGAKYLLSGEHYLSRSAG